MAYLVTGATGFLGTELAAGLIRTTEEKIYVLTIMALAMKVAEEALESL